MNIRLQHIAIGIGLISFLTFLFFKSNAIDADSHSRFTNGLRHLKELDATIDKDILRSRFGLINSYDPLNDVTREIESLEAEMKNIPAFLNSNERQEINGLMNEFSSLQNQKELLIERFKSRNAIINNSLRYFPLTTSKLIKNVSDTADGQQQAKSLNYLLQNTLILYLSTDTNLEVEIEKHIAELADIQDSDFSEDEKTDVELTLSHARTIVKLKPEIDKLITETVSIQTGANIESAIKSYDGYYHLEMIYANIYRSFLYFFAIIMLVYIGYIIFRLKKATSALNLMNESLEERVRERTEELVWSNAGLKQSEENNRALLNAIPDAMWRTNRKGVFVDLIPAKDDDSITHSTNWVGKTIFEVLPQEVAEKNMEVAKSSLESGDTEIFEYQINKGDKQFHYESRVVVFGDDEILTIVRDVTEQKSMEFQLQRAQKLESIGQLAAGIAHEINTPTQYIGDNTRFLKDSFQDFAIVLEKNEQLLTACKALNISSEIIAEMEDAIEAADIEYLLDEVPTAIDQALHGVERISKIVQSMKDFAHPGSTDMKATDLNKAIDSTITVASNEWKYVAELETDYDENLPLIRCLGGELNQVFLNMIVNAAHAIADVVGTESGEKGKISISTKRSNDRVEIRISDTGAGIPEHIQKRIFDPFFTTKEVGKGSGQGLAISHAVIVEKHNGTIQVESEIGKGTTFLISLPIDDTVKEEVLT